MELVSNSLAEGTQEQRPLPGILVNDRPLRIVGEQAVADLPLQRACVMTTDETGTYIGQRADGGCWFTHWHSHCASRGWREFKRALRRHSRRTISLKRGALNMKLEVNHD
jgi:hypothetical protein